MGEQAKPVCLSKRLQALADMVTPGNVVADVGCDHGFLSIYLVQQKISPRVYAMDVRKGPLSAAGEHIAQKDMGAYIETRLSDGLEKLNPGEADALVCAGMGGRLMQRILSEGENVAKSLRELILQPQSEIREFRIFLREQGYEILRENMIFEEEKYYFMMKVRPAGQVSGSPAGIPQHLADRCGGLLLQEKNPLLKEYLLHEQKICRQIERQIDGQSDAGERASERRRQILAELAEIRDALKLF